MRFCPGFFRKIVFAAFLGSLLALSAFARDPYEVLGVSKTATDAEIRDAYHAIAKRYHPDRIVGVPVEEQVRVATKFRQATEAYEAIATAEARANYGLLRSMQRPSLEHVAGLVAEFFPPGSSTTDEAIDALLKGRFLVERKKLAELLVLDLKGIAPEGLQQRILLRMKAFGAPTESRLPADLGFDRVLAVALRSSTDPMETKIAERALKVIKVLNLNSYVVLEAMFDFFRVHSLLGSEFMIALGKGQPRSTLLGLAKLAARSTISDGNRARVFSAIALQTHPGDAEIYAVFREFFEAAGQPATRGVVLSAGLKSESLRKEAISLTFARFERDLRGDDFSVLKELIEVMETDPRGYAAEIERARAMMKSLFALTTEEASYSRPLLSRFVIKLARKDPRWRPLAAEGEAHLRAFLNGPIEFSDLTAVREMLDDEILRGPAIRAFIERLKRPEGIDPLRNIDRVISAVYDFRRMKNPPAEIAVYFDALAQGLPFEEQRKEIADELEAAYAKDPTLRSRMIRLRMRFDSSRCLSLLSAKIPE